MVNWRYVIPKAGQVAVILINTTNRNILIHQPLLAAKVYEVELHPWLYHSVLCREQNAIKVGLQPIIPLGVEGNLQANQVDAKVKEESSKEESTPPLPFFGPHPYTIKDYHFDDMVVRLPFKFNLGHAPFSKEQQDWLLSLIYDH